MQESSLHSRLKQFYTQDGGFTEMWVDGYLIDVVKGNQLIEIQTGNFGALKTKLDYLLEHYSVRLVYPIAREKHIVLKDREYSLLSRRKSPKHGRVEHVFYELVYITSILTHPNFSLEVLITSEEEERVKDGLGSWRRSGISILDRRLVGILESTLFETPADYLAVIPETLGREFTNSELSAALEIPLRLATKISFCLYQVGLLGKIGKRGRALLYSRNDFNSWIGEH
jgi:hypothetical protein